MHAYMCAFWIDLSNVLSLDHIKRHRDFTTYQGKGHQSQIHEDSNQNPAPTEQVSLPVV